MMNSMRHVWNKVQAFWPIRLMIACALLPLIPACQSRGPVVPNEALAVASAKYNEIILREGDVVKISFPGAKDLDDTYQIRRDGKISLRQVGEVTAVGKTPAQLEKEVLALYEPQLVVKQVSVTLGSSAYPVFITGAVGRPGKVMADRPLSVLEAIMEAGGFDYKRANTKGVIILRETNGEMANFKVNLKDVLEGRMTTPFYLKPSDIVYVPEKFSWF
jgi:polysaccharide biosynthesis/export protein